MSLYVITLQGCPGCIRFKSKTEPELAKRLKGKVKIIMVDKSEVDSLPDDIKSLTLTFFPTLIFKCMKDNTLSVFSGQIINGRVELEKKVDWTVDNIIKWICHSNMNGTSCIVCEFTPKGVTLINNPLLDLLQ